MANELGQATILTPILSNVLTAAFGGWVSQTFWVEGAPENASWMNFMMEFSFDGATEIEVRAEHMTKDDLTTWFPFAKLNSSDEVVADTFKLIPGSGLTEADLELQVGSVAAVRLNAKATGPGAATTLDAKVTAGGK